MKYFNIVLLCILVLLLIPINVLADNLLDAKSVIIKLTIPTFYEVDVEPEKIVITEDDFIQAQMFDEEKIAIEKIDKYVFEFSSNIPYRLWISAAAENFAGTYGSIPVESFQWRTNKNSPWIPLSKKRSIFLENPDIGVEHMKVDFRLVVNPYISPGLYEGDIILTFESLDP